LLSVAEIATISASWIAVQALFWSESYIAASQPPQALKASCFLCHGWEPVAEIERIRAILERKGSLQLFFSGKPAKKRKEGIFAGLTD
jgi:hypothetical protein